ncbi:MAG TPA: outer membrane beta-barrel protein, partial [Chitinophagaceae bacterium]|nr:outer membrane beta-barrel protein [Chitinophagaceae bacterium]
MKKLVILTFAADFLLLLSLQSNAQFSRGTMMLGTTVGSAAYSSANSDYDYQSGETRSAGTNSFTFNIGPQIGFFLTPRFVLGATPAFNITTSHATNDVTNANNTSSASTTNTTTTTVSLGPFMRYYFSSLTSNNWFYAQINGAVGTGSGNTTANSSSTTTVGSSNGQVEDILTWNAGGSLGMTHFFYKRIGMDVALG